MGSTSLGVAGTRFTINGSPTYSELPGSRREAQGLLMNARFIQGIFDDRRDPGRFARFGSPEWDPEAHTDALAAALPEWHARGLRAFTVGFQGGGPCFTTDNDTIDNNPFGEDGSRLDRAYARRMERLVDAADRAGMIVIVSFLYGAQAARIGDGAGIRRAVAGASAFLRELGRTNIIIEVANEHDIPPFAAHPIVREEEGMAWLIDLARNESGGMPVGCSGGGGTRRRQVVDASDVVLVHGNGQSRQQFYNLLREVRAWAPDKPVVCNEYSQAIGQMAVAASAGASWGYYNNMTKQEPPVDWRILPGEDDFFSRRMAELVGIPVDPLPEPDRFHLQGFEPGMTVGGKRWIRLASLRPESVDHVDFHRDGSLFYSGWDEPFTVLYRSNWLQDGVPVQPGEVWNAVVHLRDGSTIEKTAVCP